MEEKTKARIWDGEYYASESEEEQHSKNHNSAAVEQSVEKPDER